MIRTSLAAVCVIGVCLTTLLGCSPAATTPAGAAYEAQQATCLALDTHAERTACLHKVRADWASDGGAE